MPARGAASAATAAAGAIVVGLAASAVPASFAVVPHTGLWTGAHVATERLSPKQPAVPAQADVLAQERTRVGEIRALAKGAKLTKERARAEQRRAARAASRAALAPSEDDEGDGCASSGFGGVAVHVARAGQHLREKFGVDDVGGVADRPNNPTSDHPRGYALDFMVDRSTGDALAAYAEEHSEVLGIKYILWETEDHYDHVHISFEDEAGSGLPC